MRSIYTITTTVCEDQLSPIIYDICSNIFITIIAAVIIGYVFYKKSNKNANKGFKVLERKMQLNTPRFNICD